MSYLPTLLTLFYQNYAFLDFISNLDFTYNFCFAWSEFETNRKAKTRLVSGTFQIEGAVSVTSIFKFLLRLIMKSQLILFYERTKSVYYDVIIKN